MDKTPAADFAAGVLHKIRREAEAIFTLGETGEWKK